MALTLTLYVGDYDILMTVGTGMGDGIIIEHKKYDLDDPEYIEALKTALEMYPLIDAAADLENYAHNYASSHVSDGQLRNYMYSYEDEELSRFMEMWRIAQKQTVLAIHPYMTRFVDAAQWEIERREKRIQKEQAKQVRRDRVGAGYVYLIQSPTGYYKIGRTKNPDDRMRTFGIQLPFEVEYTCIIQTNDMYSLESELHARYTKQRVNGEWFNLTDVDVEYIKGLAS
jgi:hypothetical protein